MQEDRIRWDSRYAAEGLLLGENPSKLLAERIDDLLRLCPGRKAGDIACGEGRNSIFLARCGFDVTGLDISPVGIGKARNWAAQEGLTIDFRLVDLEQFEFGESFDLIINFNFLQRDLLQKALTALNPGGVIVVDTILEAATAPVPHRKEYLLQPGELRRLFSNVAGEILYCEEFPLSDTPTAKIIFQRSATA